LLIFDEVTDKTKLAPFFYGSWCSLYQVIVWSLFWDSAKSNSHIDTAVSL